MKSKILPWILFALERLSCLMAGEGQIDIFGAYIRTNTHNTQQDDDHRFMINLAMQTAFDLHQPLV
jgi:hypothetical protein